MDEFLKFLCDHSHVIIESVLTIIVLFVTVFKKKVKVDNIFVTVLTVLPAFICESERLYTDGTEKYSYVFNQCLDLLVSLTHQKKDKLLDRYASSINQAIENVLSTPQKKER